MLFCFVSVVEDAPGIKLHLGAFGRNDMGKCEHNVHVRMHLITGPEKCQTIELECTRPVKPLRVDQVNPDHNVGSTYYFSFLDCWFSDLNIFLRASG